MSDVIDWSKAQEWATHYSADLGYFVRKLSSTDLWVAVSSGCAIAKPGGLTKRPQPTPWSGEGLPPVGTVCSHVVSGDKDYPFVEWASGDKLEVIAHREVCGVMLPIVFNLRHNTATAIQPHLLKPIRTPEQIAADEREAAIKAMAKVLGVVACDDYVAATALYDAGYRKP